MREPVKNTLSDILRTARQEFLDKGYQGASLRQIVRLAGVTTGAFYGYFQQKSTLFDALVEEEYNEILRLYRAMLEDFRNLPPDHPAPVSRICHDAGMTGMADYLYDHADAFKLLLCCSEGTRYSRLIHEMADLDIEAVQQYTEAARKAGRHIRTIHPKLGRMLSAGMLTAFFDLVVNDIPREKAADYIAQLLDFYSAGWERLLQGE